MWTCHSWSRCARGSAVAPAQLVQRKLDWGFRGARHVAPRWATSVPRLLVKQHHALSRDVSGQDKKTWKKVLVFPRFFKNLDKIEKKKKELREHLRFPSWCENAWASLLVELSKHMCGCVCWCHNQMGIGESTTSFWWTAAVIVTWPIHLSGYAVRPTFGPNVSDLNIVPNNTSSNVKLIARQVARTGWRR